MNIIIQRNHLMESINVAQKAVSPKSSTPILEGLLLSVMDQVFLTGYDSKTGIEVSLQADVLEKGKLVIPSKLFGDIVRNLADEVVTLKSDERNVLTIESGASEFSIKCIDADSYPMFTEIEDAEEVCLPQKIFSDMIKQTVFAVSKDSARPILNGVNIKTSGNQLLVAAIDGFRMAIRAEELDTELPDMTIIVPAKALTEVARIVGEEKENISIKKSHNNILFCTKNVKVITRLIKGEYYNFFTSIPSTTESFIECKREDLLNAINRAAVVITDENQHSVTLSQQNENKLIIEARTDVGTAHEEIDIESEGKFIDFDYRPRFLLEAIKAIEDEKLYISIGQRHNSCVFTTGSINDKKEESIDKYVYMVLPLMR